MNRWLCMEKVVLSLAALMLVLSFVHAASAQTPDPSDQVQAIAKQLNCPTCAGRNLADCPTDTCMQWKQEIRTQLQQGKSAQEVMDYFQNRFGPSVLQEPPKEGALLVVWVLPAIGLTALAIGALIVLWRVGRAKAVVVGTGAGVPAPEPTADDIYAARLEEEVRQSGR